MMKRQRRKYETNRNEKRSALNLPGKSGGTRHCLTLSTSCRNQLLHRQFSFKIPLTQAAARKQRANREYLGLSSSTVRFRAHAVAAEVGRGGVLAGFDDAFAGGAGFHEQLVERVALAEADGALQRGQVLAEAAQHLQ